MKVKSYTRFPGLENVLRRHQSADDKFTCKPFTEAMPNKT